MGMKINTQPLPDFNKMMEAGDLVKTGKADDMHEAWRMLHEDPALDPNVKTATSTGIASKVGQSSLRPVELYQASPTIQIPDDVQLTPELLLYVLSERMNDLDGQIATHMQSLSGATAKAKQLSTQIQGLNELQTSMGDSKKIELDTHKVGNMTARDFLKSRGVEIPAGDAKISVDQLNSRVEALGQEQSRANSNNQLDMIKLQSAMDRRSQSIQFVTNLLKQMHQTNQAVIRNLV